MTAVEWLIEQMNKNTWYDESNYPQVNIGVIDIEQAKEMEKRQQGYSEEEVLVLLQDIQAQVGIDYNDNFMFADKWFEQFKKK